MSLFNKSSSTFEQMQCLKSVCRLVTCSKSSATQTQFGKQEHLMRTVDVLENYRKRENIIATKSYKRFQVIRDGGESHDEKIHLTPHG